MSRIMTKPTKWVCAQRRLEQAEIIEAFKSTSRYLDDLLNIDNPYFEGMVNRIYPPELQLNKANTSDTEAPFLDLHLSISNGFVSSKIYDKRDDFDFDIVNFPFLDGDVPRSASNEVYISQLIRFARVSSHVADFNARNKSLTAKLLQQGYRSLDIHRVWSESSLCAQWVAKDTSFLHVDSEDSDQTGRMPRLIWVFAGRTAILLVLSCIKPSISPNESSVNQAPYRIRVLTICGGWKKIKCMALYRYSTFDMLFVHC